MEMPDCRGLGLIVQLVKCHSTARASLLLQNLCDSRQVVRMSISRHDHSFQVANLMLRVLVARMVITQNLFADTLQMCEQISALKYKISKCRTLSCGCECIAALQCCLSTLLRRSID